MYMINQLIDDLIYFQGCGRKRSSPGTWGGDSRERDGIPVPLLKTLFQALADESNEGFDNYNFIQKPEDYPLYLARKLPLRGRYD